MSKWAQHGSYSLHWQGDVLMAVYGGAWNEVAARNLHRAALALWRERGSGDKTRHWGLLSDARDWDGGTPEALEAWWAFFADGVNHGMVAVTDVLPSRFHAAMVRKLAERAVQIAPYRNSACVEEGLAWLAQQGLNIADAEPKP
ncbi:hypothetical protein [Roseateles oligotrophus]|uniref:STAS/SEC14 domain-containing protein n=1 Tax=Roseateles oligotrophus TaxID=1769250 RepID=A0ABT2YMK5_9BURK|nr:hypothetical protein [Roseateles oligotrophus]MCV2371286.1 hypothetical protein [Roseateles oligotrophus]